MVHAQQAMKDSASYAVKVRPAYSETAAKLSIYPVPVKNNRFTIKTDREVSFVKVTNIIGQDIFREKYNDPQQLIHVSLDAPQRGMYLVTIIFDDGLRVVKKIMIEESK
jgi:hypothetical protein